MKLRCLVILFLLLGAGSAQLTADRERFDIELHPGEVIEKVLTLTNEGDTPLLEISKTSVGGIAKDLVYLDMPESEILEPGSDEEIEIFFAIPPETRPGTYTGFVYLMGSQPPSMPLVVEFYIDVVGQASYGLSLTINDAEAASISAEADESAEMDLVVRNVGQFRDVASIDASSIPEGWSVSIIDGEDEMALPYALPLNPGASHELKLIVDPARPGEKGQVNIMAASMGNSSVNSTVLAQIEFGMAVRKYKAEVELPQKLVVNKTYKGSFSIELDVEEDIQVGVVTPPYLMVIPLSQTISVTPDRPGRANFTLLAYRPGDYPVIFQSVDSNGMALPDEVATVFAAQPRGLAVLTMDNFLYKTIASLGRSDNQSVPVILAPLSGLGERDRESLLSYSEIIILGNSSVVSAEVEVSLSSVQIIKRIEADDVCETSWRYASEMWKNGSSGVVISTPKDIDIFKAYQEARMLSFPLIVCSSGLNNASRSIAEGMTKRSTRLSKALIVGEVAEDTKGALEKMGIIVEEVAS